MKPVRELHFNPDDLRSHAAEANSDLHNYDRFFLERDRAPESILAAIQPGEQLAGLKVKKSLKQSHCESTFKTEDPYSGKKHVLKIAPLAAENPACHQLKQTFALYRSLGMMSGILPCKEIPEIQYKGHRFYGLQTAFCKRGSLKKWLKNYAKAPENQKEGLSLFTDLCRSIADFHANGFVIADMRPENFLIYKKRLVLADLKHVVRQNSAYVDDSQNENKALQHNDNADSAPIAFCHAAEALAYRISDNIYSLGSLLTEIVYSKQRQHPLQLLPEIRGQFLRKEAGMQDTPEQRINGIILKCMDPSRDRRYTSAIQLLSDLQGQSQYYLEDFLPDAFDNIQPVDLFWEKVEDALDDENYQLAATFCEEILQLQPEHLNAKVQLLELKHREQQADNMIQVLQSSNGLQGLHQRAEYAKEIIAIYPNHPKLSPVLAKLSTDANSYRNSMDAGVQSILQNQLKQALEHFEQAVAINCEDPLATSIRRRLACGLQEIEQLRCSIDQAVQRGEHDEARRSADRVDNLMAELSQAIVAEFHSFRGKNDDY